MKALRVLPIYEGIDSAVILLFHISGAVGGLLKPVKRQKERIFESGATVNLQRGNRKQRAVIMLLKKRESVTRKSQVVYITINVQK